MEPVALALHVGVSGDTALQGSGDGCMERRSRAAKLAQRVSANAGVAVRRETQFGGPCEAH